MTNLPIPATPNDLTTAWLSGALRQGTHADELAVSAFTTTPLAANRGFYGQVVRVHLDYVPPTPGAPQVLIAKFSAPNAEMRQRSVDSYAREVRFYQALARQTALATPACYYADIDVATGDHILLLQDLAPMQSGSRVAGCTVDQAWLAISEIAKLHAHWWQRTEDGALAWLADNDTQVDHKAMRQQYDEWWPAFYAQAQGQVPAALVEFSAQLGNHRAAIRRHSFGSSPRTLIHRDFQLDNLLFGAEADTPAFAIIDWQFLSRGHGVWDVAYLLSESLLPEDRRRVDRELLARYHRTLVDQGINDYSWAQCYTDFCYALLQRHTALVSTIAAMPFSAEQRDIHINTLLPRNVAAILDHNAATILHA